MTEAPVRRHAPLNLLQPAACGSLGPAASLAVGIHAQHCPQCSARLAELDSVGGALLETQDDAPFDTNASLASVLDRLDQAVSEPAYPVEVLSAPDSLRPAFADALSRGGWTYAGAGLRTIELNIPGANRFAEQPQMLKIEPGYGAPRHSHRAMELTLVLDGAFRDETGVYGPGDLAVAVNSLTHRPIAEPGRTCLAFAVSYAPMRFTGLLGLAQRLLTPRS